MERRRRDSRRTGRNLRACRLVGMPGYARRAGRAMAAAPEGLPCHRVVNSQGRTAPGWTRQRELLEAEGVLFRANGRVDLSASGWKEIG